MPFNRYTSSDLYSMREKLLEIQRKKKLFVTVREAVSVFGASDSTSAARYKLDALVSNGLAEKIRNHYHVKETDEIGIGIENIPDETA